MIKKLRTLLFLLFIASPAMAFAMSNAPKYCPGVEVVKATPYIRAVVDEYLGWVAMTENSTYDTQDEWTAIMFVGSHDSAGKDLSESDAIALANTYLPRVMKAAKPTPEEEDDGSYFCFYTDNIDNPQVVAITMTPAYQDIGKKLLRMKKANSFTKFLTLLQ